MKKLTLLCAFAMTLGIPSLVSAQATINLHFTITTGGTADMPWGPPLTTFRKGDILTMTAVLHQPGIPPNDMSFCQSSGLFPGLFVYIAYNNGQNPTVIFRDAYEVPIGFGPYTLDVDNGTLYATVRCVTADLDISLKPPSPWQSEDKQWAAQQARRFQGYGLVVGAVGTPCLFVTGQFGILCKAAASIAGLAMGASAWYMQGLANDPSDPNFTVIAQPVPITQSSGGPLDCGDFPECNAWVGNFLQIISLQRTILITNDRWQGAYDAGDLYWQDQQKNALTQYQAQLATLDYQDATLTQAFQTAFISRMAAAGATPMVVSAADITTWRTNTQGGWTFDQQNILSAMGLTFDEMESIRSFLLAADTSTLGGSDYPEALTGGDYYTVKSGFINAFSNGTQAVPTPPVTVSAGGLKLAGKRYTLALLSTATFNATQVATTTITFGRTGRETPPLSCSNSDNNRDGRIDKVCTFDSAAAGFQTGDTLAWVHFTYNGARFYASTPK